MTICIILQITIVFELITSGIGYIHHLNLISRECQRYSQIDDKELYTNQLTKFLGNFITKEISPPQSVRIEIPFSNKLVGMSLQKMCRLLDDGLRKDGWFVTGNVDRKLFDENFTFKDPDVKIIGIDAYASGVRKIFNQKTSRADIVSTVVNDTLPNTITVTWRLEGSVNIGPGLRIKPYVIYTNFRTSTSTGLIEFQEDIFSIPGSDILLSAIFPFLSNWLSPPAPPVEKLRQQYASSSKKSK